MKDLRGKRVLLTGASTGIGPYIARRLHKEGVSLVLSARNEKAMRSLAHELGGAEIIPADLSLQGEAERLAKEAGRVDILVSNAGIPATGAITDFTVEQIDRAVMVNLRSGMVLARQLAPAMKRKGDGHIVFMGSIAGKVATPGASVYNATKFGLRGFAFGMREDLHGTGVGVSLIAPTFVNESGMFAETGLKAHPMAGEVSPESVAEAVVKAIKQNRAEIDVAPPHVIASTKFVAVAPSIAAAVARRGGAHAMAASVGEKQKHKR